MSAEFASAGLTAGQLNAIVKKLGGHDMALRFLRGELSVSEPTRSWREEDGVIYFSVTSDGTTGEGWIRRLRGNGFHVENYAKQILRSLNFRPTSGVTTEVAVLKSVLFEDNDRITDKIRDEASRRNLTTPNAELACLIREKFTNEEFEAMRLRWIVVMHEPISNFDGDPSLMFAYYNDVGRWLGAYDDVPVSRWNRCNGFAFTASSRSAQV